MNLFIDTQILIWFYCSKNKYIQQKIKDIRAKDTLFIHYHNVKEFKKMFTSNAYFLSFKNDILSSIFDKLLFDDGFKFDVMREPFPTKYECRDKSDNFLLNFALHYGYDGIISNDKDLLSLKDKIPNFKIVSVEERWIELFA